MKIQFILTGEGTSDLNLVDHIENVLIEEGFTEASGEAPDLGLLPVPVGNTVRERIVALLKLHPNADVIFVHRDADTHGITAREREIFAAVDGLVTADRVIPMIPVKELETWLLTDHAAIKRVAGNPNHDGDLNCIPPIRQLENVGDAKKLLLTALCEASETQGTRLKKFRKQFFEMRARLAFDLELNGPVMALNSYKYFREKISAFAQQKLGNVGNAADQQGAS